MGFNNNDDPIANKNRESRDTLGFLKKSEKEKKLKEE